MPDNPARSLLSDVRLPGIEATARELLDARRPPEYSAAQTLAVAQRDLALARACTPGELAGWERLPGQPWTDPDTEYAAWVERMLTFEAQSREMAARSVAAGYAYDRHHPRAVGPLAEVIAAALRRARAAIALMSGVDEAAAQTARLDVLRNWRVDDRLALLGYGAPRALVDQLVGSVD